LEKREQGKHQLAQVTGCGKMEIERGLARTLVIDIVGGHGMGGDTKKP